jgi:hypothetical protein
MAVAVGFYHQRGEGIMAQGQLPFQYEEERREFGMTALAGLPVYLDLAQVMKLRESIGRHLHVRDGGQGWSDAQVVLSLILLNLAGGECVDDLRVMEEDEGGPARGPVALGEVWAECGLVVDHGVGAQPQRGDEGIGAREVMGVKEDEGD